MQHLSLLSALAPLSVYLLFLGVVNLSSKQRLLTGRQDFMALSLGISGLIIGGPMQSLLPQAGIIRFGTNAWYPLVLLYLFGTTWLLLLSRQRMIIYNLSQKEFATFIKIIADREKWHVRWHGNIMEISEIEIQFEIISFNAMNSLTLRATRSQQSITGWQILRQAIRSELQSHHPKFKGIGFLFIIGGLLSAVTGWACTLSG